MSGLDWMLVLIGAGIAVALVLVSISFFADRKATRNIKLKKAGIPPRGYEWTDRA